MSVIKNTQTTMKCSDEKWNKIFKKKKEKKDEPKQKEKTKKRV